MQTVHIQIKQIEWSDVAAWPDADMPPSELSSIMTLSDGDCETAQSIDAAIADHLENLFGIRPIKWVLWVFDPACEAA